MTRAPSLGKSTICCHEPRQHGSNEFGGLDGLFRCLPRERLSIGDEIAMQRSGQLDRHLHRLVVLDRAELQLRYGLPLQLG